MKIAVKTNANGPSQMAEILKENAKTYIVRLPDGKVIKRHKIKHVIPG